MESKAKFLTGSIQERVAIALFTPFLALLCVGCLISVEARFGGASGRDGLWDQLFHAMFFEMFIAFLLFLALAFLWALFRPGWVGRALDYAGRHVWHALCLFLLGFLVSILILNASRSHTIQRMGTGPSAQAWLASRGHDIAHVIEWLDTQGGFCDCEVLANVEERVDDATKV